MRNTVNLFCLKEHMSIDELAAALGMSRPKVVDILKQDTVIDADTLGKLCSIFHCEASDLVM